MQIPFSLYDFLGYALPGFIVIVIVAILVTGPPETNQQSPIESWLDSVQSWLDSVQKLINPEATPTNKQDNAKNGLTRYLPTTVSQLILYVVACYLIGFVIHGLVDWLFGMLSRIWEPLKRYHSDHGTFERELLEPEHRVYPEDFGPYTNQFVHKLKTQIKNIFDIDIRQADTEKKESPIKYTEIFHLCRTTVLKQSPDLYPRVLALLARYNSAKLMGAIFFFATFAFFVKLVGFQQGVGWITVILMSVLFWSGKKGSRLRLAYGLVVISLALIAWSEKGTDPLFIYYCVSATLCPIFFYLYHLLFRYYRNTVLYGFYEYAVTREKSGESKNSEN